MMKIKFLGGLIFLVLGGLLFCFGQVRADPSPRVEPKGDSLISMDFQDADLKDVLKVFSQQAGLNFIAGEKVKGRKVTLYLEKVTVQDALETIIDASDLTYTQAEDSKIFIVKELDMPEIELATRVFTLKHAPVYKIVKEEAGGRGKEIEPSDIVLAIEEMLTDGGRVTIDVRTNSIVVIDRPYNMKAIKELIEGLDVKAPQVMIEVEVLETSLDALEALGFEWGGSSGQLFSFSLARSAFTFPYQQVYENLLGWRGKRNYITDDDIDIEGQTTATATVTGVTPGTLGTSDVAAILELLTRDVETKILSRPRILTSNNQTASIMVGVKFPIVTTRVSPETGQITGASLEKYYDIGIQLKVTPQVSPDNYINMILEPAVTSYTETVETKTSAGITLVEYPIIRTREAKTQILVKEGETIVVGGLIDTWDTETMRKVPFLGDIPILGSLFRKKDVRKSDMELIFFITPYVVREEVASIETHGSAGGLQQGPRRPQRQWIPASQRGAEIKRAIEEAEAKIFFIEPGASIAQEALAPDGVVGPRELVEERGSGQLFYEEALAKYKLISGWEHLE